MKQNRQIFNKLSLFYPCLLPILVYHVFLNIATFTNMEFVFYYEYICPSQKTQSLIGTRLCAFYDAIYNSNSLFFYRTDIHTLYKILLQKRIQNHKRQNRRNNTRVKQRILRYSV